MAKDDRSALRDEIQELPEEAAALTERAKKTARQAEVLSERIKHRGLGRDLFAGAFSPRITADGVVLSPLRSCEAMAFQAIFQGWRRGCRSKSNRA